MHELNVKNLEKKKPFTLIAYYSCFSEKLSAHADV